MRTARRLFLEPLEARYTMNADVDGNGMVVPMDALLVANALNNPGEFAFASSLDVTRDGSLTTADFDAVVAALDDVGDGSAGGGDDANELLGEGEGSESGGGEGTPVVSMSVSGSVVDEDGETTQTITLYRTGPVTSTLTVGVFTEGAGSDYANTNDYQLLRNGTPIGGSVVFGIDEAEIELTVKAVDDTTEEPNEGRNIGIAESTDTPATYTRHQYAYHQVFTIKDDEWRWVYATTSNYEFEWAPVPTAIVRDGFDGALYPKGSALVGLNSVTLKASAKAVYVYEYTATVPQGRVDFSCNAQTGAIAVTTVPATLVNNPNTWVSAGLDYDYSISDGSGDVHTVQVDSEFMAGAGGTHGGTPTSGTGWGHGNTAWTGVETWAVAAPSGTHSATLRCSKGPDPNE